MPDPTTRDDEPTGAERDGLIAAGAASGAIADQPARAGGRTPDDERPGDERPGGAVAGGDVAGSARSGALGTAFEARPVDHLRDPRRLATIARLGLTDVDRDDLFDRAGRIASQLLGAEVALVTMVTDDAQHFAGAAGLDLLDEEVARTRTTPLSHSLCRTVVDDQATLSITHGSRDARFADHPAIRELGIEAYLGVPVRDASGATLGSFCVIDRRPRAWTGEDVARLEDLGALVRSEVLLREQLEQLRYSARMRDDLMRAAAHDLRASISAIGGAARTLQANRAGDPDVQAQILDVIVRQSERTEQLLGTLLHRPGPDVDGHRAVALHELVATTVDAAVASLGDGHQDRIDRELAEVWAHTMPEPVERGLLNLVRNALQHTSGRVQVRTCGVDDLAVIEVADQGPGLPDWMVAGDLGNAALLGRAAGHGIGVFSAVTLVRSVAGEVTYDSTPTGTVFRVLLPSLLDPPETSQAAR